MKDGNKQHLFWILGCIGLLGCIGPVAIFTAFNEHLCQVVKEVQASDSRLKNGFDSAEIKNIPYPGPN
jgi:hypothetical protein